MNRLFLGRVVRHPSFGLGAISFEEQDVANTGRTLQATFTEVVLTGNVYQLRDDGVKWNAKERLTLAEYPQHLNDHHGADGMAMDEAEVRRALVTVAEVAA